ncbi:hypothetical protein JTB14_012563 [Gonioctena quinquepunctata]|nr:hypothetical protein JTB14_012563 [Gonioctena quinquepunctata]
MSPTSIRIENKADMHFSRQQQNIASFTHGSYQQKNRLEIQRPSQSDVGSPASGRGRIQLNKIQGQRQKHSSLTTSDSRQVYATRGAPYVCNKTAKKTLLERGRTHPDAISGACRLEKDEEKEARWDEESNLVT